MRTVKMTTWLTMGFLVLIAAGCARPDWIEQTLVTVDMTGVWQGTYSRTMGSGTMELTLQQNGAKVTGQARVSSLSALDGPIEGNVGGDTFRFRHPRGLSGELQVNGDEMTGTGTLVGGATFTLRWQQ